MKTRFLMLIFLSTVVVLLPMSNVFAQVITATPTTLVFGNNNVMNVNPIVQYTLSGTALTGAPGNITVTPPAGFTVSLTTSGFASSLLVPYGAATLAATTIYVMFTPTSATSFSGNISNAGGGAATVNVAVSGGVTAVTNWLRSTATGNWSSLSWEGTTDAGATWSAASVPTGSENIVLQDGHIVTVDVPVSITGYLKSLNTATSQATSGSTASGLSTITLTGSNARISVGQVVTTSVASALSNGTTVSAISGSTLTLSQVTIAIIADASTLTFTPKGAVIGAGSLTFGNGSTYDAAGNGGPIPTATWNTGSTCLVTGAIANAPSNANQNFSNFTWNCPAQTGNINLWTPVGTYTINNDFTVKNTGATGRFHFGIATAGTNLSHNVITVNILGNLIVDGSTANATNQVSVTANGSGNGFTDDIINISGNVSVTGNATNVAWTNFSPSRGSQGGTGISLFNISGNFSMSNATSQNSNVGGAKFVFAKAGTQAATITSVTYGSSGVNYQIASGATLQLTQNTAVNSLMMAGGTLNLNGFTLTYSGSSPTITYNGSSGQITSNAEYPTTTGPTSLVINNAAGVTLHASRTVTGTLTLTSGNLVTTTANLLTLGSAGIVSGGSASSFVDGPLSHTWTTATATKTYPLGKGATYRPLIIALTTPQSPVLRAEVFNANAGGSSALNAISTARYYQTSLVSGTAVSGGTVKITYGADDGVSDFSQLVVAICTTVNGTYLTLGGAAGDATSITSVTAYNPGSGSFLLMGSTGTNVLPVELASFSGTAHGRNVELQWSTATEISNSGFEVQKNVNGSWAKIGFVNGAGTSNIQHSYRYSDVTSSAASYSYRLKQIDRDGNFSYSNAIEVTTTLTAEDFKLTQNYPNPFNPSTKLNFAAKNAEQTSLKIYNVVGEEVATLFNDVAQPNQVYTLTFDAKNFSSGMYYYVLHSASRNEVKKMMLLK